MEKLLISVFAEIFEDFAPLPTPMPLHLQLWLPRTPPTNLTKYLLHQTYSRNNPGNLSFCSNTVVKDQVYATENEDGIQKSDIFCGIPFRESQKQDLNSHKSCGIFIVTPQKFWKIVIYWPKFLKNFVGWF
jgi:hypothetical protein